MIKIIMACWNTNIRIDEINSDSNRNKNENENG